jgi:hypothetical protein
MLARHNIAHRPTTTKNPQANAICKCMHQTIGNTLRAMADMNPPEGIEMANQLVDAALADCVFATRAAIHGSLQSSPGALAFGRDMILDIPRIADCFFQPKAQSTIIDSWLPKPTENDSHTTIVLATKFSK